LSVPNCTQPEQILEGVHGAKAHDRGKQWLLTNARGVPYRAPLIDMATRANVIAVLQPTVCVAVMETDSIKTSRIAYSTEVGPSSERPKIQIFCTN
jgi:hypothetical protein